MVRNVIGSVIALAGATAAVWSPFRAWYDGRHGSDYRIQDLFDGISLAGAAVWGSVLLPFAFAALVTVLGVLLRSRPLIVVAGVIVLGFSVLWMIRQGQAIGSLTVSGDGTGVGDGVAAALGGGVLLLLGAAVMSGRGEKGGTRELPPIVPVPDEAPPRTIPLPPVQPRRPRPDPYGWGPPPSESEDSPWRPPPSESEDPWGPGRPQAPPTSPPTSPPGAP
ncbi:hypothetical protein [Streptomyces sp. NPDC000410]|uniref:hypothetical protein n=1 Tax=Streptomyces sp. NPDC000410 TaxID=3154254 RepID=UPI003319CCDC